MAKRTLALLSGSERQSIASPLFPRFSKRAISRVVEMLERGRTVALGQHAPEIKEVEAALSRYHGGRQALALSSGTAALHAALIGLEVGPGHEDLAHGFRYCREEVPTVLPARRIVAHWCQPIAPSGQGLADGGRP